MVLVSSVEAALLPGVDSPASTTKNEADLNDSAESAGVDIGSLDSREVGTWYTSKLWSEEESVSKTIGRD